MEVNFNGAACGGRCTVIAEIAQAHDGSLGTAHAYIDAAANAGADAVKFQTHIASAESTPAEPWRIRFSRQDETRYDYWRRMEFSAEQWAGLKQHASERALRFISSPFSAEAADLLERIGVEAWKIASGEINNPLLFERVANSGLPVYVSSGMSSMAEVESCVRQFQTCGTRFVLMQCTSAYPCPPERVGLNVMRDYRERFGCPVGLSDHSGTIYAGLAAAALGADAVEVHITFSREAFGPDVPASITTSELRQLVEGVRFIERMRGNPVDKDAMAGEMGDLRRTFRKSVVSRYALEPGVELRPEHLTAKKPGAGIPVERLPELVGRRVKRAVAAGAFLAEDDLD
jgi:N-acetylneuraminate synthase